MTQKLWLIFVRRDNINSVGKEESALHQHFFFSCNILKSLLPDDDDFVGFRSLCALGIYGMDQERERIGYTEIQIQAPSSSSNRSPWFFNMPSIKHRFTPGYLWVSNQFTSSWVGNTRCLRKFPTRPGIEPRTSGLIVKRFTATLPHDPSLLPQGL